MKEETAVALQRITADMVLQFFAKPSISTENYDAVRTPNKDSLRVLYQDCLQIVTDGYKKSVENGAK
jgi:hypothetical protein